MQQIRRIIATYITLLTILTIATHSARAQAWLWGKSHTGQGSLGYSVITEHATSVYGGATVLFPGSSNFGSGVVLPFASSDPLHYQAAFVKYNTAGVPQWAEGTQNGNAMMISLTTDNDGNVIVLGSYTTPTITLGATVLTNPAGVPGAGPTHVNARYFLAKYNAAGVQQWAVAGGNCHYGNFGWMSSSPYAGKSLATDAAGNIYMVGSFIDATTTVGTYTLTNSDPSGTTEDLYVAKYDPAGNVLWARAYGGSLDDWGLGVLVHPGGDIYMTGAFYSAALPLGSTTLLNPTGPPPVTRPKTFICRLSPTGTPVWAMDGGNRGGSVGIAMVCDEAGDVYWTGTYGDTVINFGTTALTRAYLPNVWSSYAFEALYLLKISHSSNNILWAKSISATNSAVIAYGVATRCGRVWVSARYRDTADVDGAKLLPTPIPWGLKPPALMLAGYTTGGTRINMTGLNAWQTAADACGDIACDAAGNLLLCTSYTNSVNVGATTISTPGQHHMLVAKYGSFAADTMYKSYDTTLCGASTMTLTADTGYTSYLWDNGTTGATRDVTVSGTYWTIANGGVCLNTTLIDSFKVGLGDGDTTYNHTTQSFCASAGPLTLNAQPGYSNYLWSTGSTTPVITVATTNTYYVVATKDCDMAVDTFSVTANPTPEVTITQRQRPCAPTVLKAAPAGYVSYVWSNGLSGDSITSADAVTYTVTVTDNNGCSASASAMALPMLPGTKFLTNVTRNQIIPYGSTVQLNAWGALYYSWTPTGSLTNPNINNPVAQPEQTTVYTVYGIDASGCRDTASVKIDVIYDDIFIPSAFTPNGDGLNDLFRIINKGGYKVNEVLVMNRWGEPVYAPGDGGMDGWDGTYKGVPQDGNVYYYLIRATRPDGEQKTYKGDVTLIR